jgi:hypothetical protein
VISDSSQKLKQLLEKVRELTDQDRISWRETASHDRFIAVLDSGCVEIERRVHWDENDAQEIVVYEATLLNRSGNVVETMCDQTFKDSEAGLLPDLFRLARRKARKSESVVDEVLGELRAMAGA